MEKNLKLMVATRTFFLVLLACTVTQVNSFKNAHSYFVKQNICQIVKQNTYEGFFNLIVLKCEWRMFVDAMAGPNGWPIIRKALLKMEESTMNANPLMTYTRAIDDIYELEFFIHDELRGVSEDDDDEDRRHRYVVVSGGLFEPFKIRSLKLSGLGLRVVLSSAFSSRSMRQLLERLDLSNNSLKRLDSNVLENLPHLERLNLSSNRLALGEYNFKANKNLAILDLSNNSMQYLSPHVFANLNSIEVLDLSNNELRAIDSCTFANIQLNELSIKYAPPTLNLNNNAIECDCDLFYLNRWRHYKLELTCASPDYYAGRRFVDLKREDPSARCNYAAMSDSCQMSDISQRDFVLIVIFALLTTLFLLISACCLCRNMALKRRIRKAELEAIKGDETKFSTLRKMYVSIPVVKPEFDKLNV